MKEFGGSAFQFESSGRHFSANDNIIGIDEEWQTFGGYDQSLGANQEPYEFSADERRELADFMIARWTEYRNK